MYMYYNTLFEKKQDLFVRKFKKMKLFNRFRYNSLITSQVFVDIFVNFYRGIVVDRKAHTIYSIPPL